MESKPFNAAFEVLHQPEVDEAMQEAHQDHLLAIESEVWQNLQDGIDGGWLTQTEADTYYAEWMRTYRGR